MTTRHPDAAPVAAPADLLSGRSGATVAPSPSLRLAALLGRREGRRALLGVAAVVVAVAVFTAAVTALDDSSPTPEDFIYLLEFLALLSGLGAMLVLNLATTRERREGASGLFDAAPGAPAARTGGVLVAALVPAAAMLLVVVALGPLVALFTAYDVGDPQVSPLRGDGMVGLLILGRHSELVLLGGVLGVALGTWLPRFWVALPLIPPLFVFGVFGTWGVGGKYAWLAPNANQLSIRLQYDYTCEVDRLCLQFPQPLGEFTPYAHLIYVAALCGVLGALALVRRTRSWQVLLFGGLALAASAGLGISLVG